MNLKYLLYLLSLVLLNACDYSAGALGGFPNRTFPISKRRLEITIDTLYSLNPKFKVPGNWESADSSMIKSYSYLESRTFYFKNDPEEMYYVTFVGDAETFNDTTKTPIAIRAVNRGGSKWYKYRDLDDKEKAKIESRFDLEIIHRIEIYTKTKADREIY